MNDPKIEPVQRSVPGLAGAASQQGEAVLSQILSQTLSLINDQRLALGQAALTLSAPLCEAAQGHAADMSARGYFGYAPPGPIADSGVEARIIASGYRGRTGVNLSRGHSDAAEIVAAILADANTRQSLLNASYRELGVGESQSYWTLIFGAPARLVTPELQQRARDRLNGQRAAIGVPPVELSPALSYAAQRHSLDRARSGLLGSTGSDGSTTERRVREAGFDGTAQELLAHERELDAALSEWLADPVAQKTLLAAPVRQLGLGMAEGMLTLLVGVPATVAVNTSADLQARVLTLINDYRQTIKVAPLTLHSGLCAAAAAHAQDMADQDFFAFAHPGRTGIAGHLTQCGYRGRTLPAVTMGQTTADAVVQLLLGSAEHRRNLLDGEIRDLGVGVTRSRWTVIVGTPPAEASDAVRDQLLALINAQRALSTAPPLRLSAVLCTVAQAYADDMARRGYFAFQTPEGEPLTTQVQRAGFDGRVVPALVKGYASPAAALDPWMKSAGNRQNLLDPRLLLAGIGVADSRWVLLLAADAPSSG